MIRGTIEYVNRETVTGWLYSEEAPVRGRLALAFLDDVCIGAGRIEVHRPDLEAAGLGDGYLGFSFPVMIPNPADVGRVILKLENSDVVLLQRGAKVVWPQTEFSGPVTRARAESLVASYKWMLSHGWLKQSDYDYLKTLTQFGIYERTLITGTASGDVQRLDARLLSNELLSLLHQVNVELTEHRPATADAFKVLMDEVRERPGRTAVSLWSSERGAMHVHEASHLGDVDQRLARAGAVRFPIDPDRLVILDAHCQVDFADQFSVPALRVFVPSELA